MIRQAKAILALFAHTVTAYRLYPSFHENVTKFADEFYNTLSCFLEDLGTLEVRVEEKSFLLGDEVIYQDEGSLKNLPYLFFKDGMRALAFQPGLDRKELAEFLEIIKVNAELPTEESDIVDALWGGDFEHIRYEAPEDFLINKMSRAGEGEITIDRKDLYSGQINLDSTDLAAFNAGLLEVGRTVAKDPSEWADLYSAFDQGDLQILGSMLASDRSTSSDREFIETLSEILFLEERMDSFGEVLSVLSAYFRNLVSVLDRRVVTFAVSVRINAI